MINDLSFELWRRNSLTRKPMDRLDLGLTIEGVLVELKRIVEADDVFVLNKFGVVIEGNDPTTMVPACDVWAYREDLGQMIVLLTGMKAAPQFNRVSRDVVLSKLIENQLGHNKPVTMVEYLSANAVQSQLRDALFLIEALGFVVAKEVDDAEA